MKLLMVGNFLSRSSGSKGVSEELAERLVGKGWGVITTSDKPERLLRLADIVATIYSQRRQYEVAHIDVYSGRAFLWAELGQRILRQFHKPVLLTLHGGRLPDFARRWPGRVSRLLDEARYVTTPSRYLQKQLEHIRPDIVYIPNGLDLDRYAFSLRAKIKPKISWLRAFHHIYNPILAIKTVSLLHKKFPDVHLTMIGPDKGDGCFKQVKQLIRALDLDPHVELMGPIPKAEVPAALQQCDIFLNTTDYESFGVAVMEAGALGLPIISTNVGELPHLWSHGETALLVPPNDARAMAEAVGQVLTEPRLAGTLSRGARANAEQFDWQAILPVWESLFDEILSTRD